jgi:hypothetical protein
MHHPGFFGIFEEFFGTTRWNPVATAHTVKYLTP